ncbi:type II toxin-antitoxin system VapB family antitoxin [Paraburkholderia sp. MMS20-SJTN17]|uniref:Type II toxin-antitoxin system VapB family antitoxin n=1 Tax=Paraburkholderia translucens TaxID=2886945 RepID=A0ABS8KAA2_9BURK|nr:type II toxin-antitoxin system VapB family antitoxin [Paraburkholderia sp. MMS20-SJTN17]MCC8401662.1 type II toxin-antitoxin system VapB family antitoxin [Paraburkholderia sp. MMS20-SJTN17]
MRINIEIDDRLMADALAATGLKTTREVVKLGLRTIHQLQRQKEAVQYLGKLNWQGDEKMRTG